MVLTPIFCHFIPEKKDLESGKLYISEDYGATSHLCPCGCDLEVHVPIRPFWPDGWNYINNNGVITLLPSIGNWQFPCRSHYYITNNEVIWAKQTNGR